MIKQHTIRNSVLLSRLPSILVILGVGLGGAYFVAFSSAATAAPTGSLSCRRSSASEIVVDISYSNASSTNYIEFRQDSSILNTYTNGTQSFGYGLTNLPAGKSYTFRLLAGAHHDGLASIVCSTTAANTTTTAQPAPAPAPSPSPAPSSSSAPTATTDSGSDPASDPGNIEIDYSVPYVIDSPEPAEVLFDGESGIVVEDPAYSELFNDSSGLSGGVGEYTTTELYNTSTDESSYAPAVEEQYAYDSSGNIIDTVTGDKLDPNTPFAKKAAKILHTRSAKTFKKNVAFGGSASLLLLFAASVYLVLRRRQPTTTLVTIDPYADLLDSYRLQPQLTLPQPATTAYTPQAQIVSPAQSQQPPVIQQPPTPINLNQNNSAIVYPMPIAHTVGQPMDMYEEAREHPERYGNSQYEVPPVVEQGSQQDQPHIQLPQ